MELYQLEQFMAMAQTCNMHVAADQIKITQPALSKNLKKLEAELGCQLFERTRNKLELNEYGKIVLKHCKDIFEEVKLLRTEIEEQKEKEDQIMISSGYSLAALYFIMPHLAHAFPEMLFICDIKNVGGCHKQFQEGKSDFIISDKKYDSDEYLNIKIFDEDLMITIPGKYHFENKDMIELDELQKLEHFILPEADGYTDWFLSVLKTANVDADKISFYPIEKYLNSKSEFQTCNLCSSLIIHFVPEISGKKVLRVNSRSAKRQLYVVLRKKDKKRFSYLYEFLKDKNNNLFSNVSFLPYFMFRNESSNLLFK